MDESFLKKTSLLVFIIGLTMLFCLFLFQQPFIVSLGSDIPLDKVSLFNATVLDVYSSSGGSFVVFSVTETHSGFFHGNLSFLEVGSQVSVLASQNEEYLSIKSLTT